MGGLLNYYFKFSGVIKSNYPEISTLSIYALVKPSLKAPFSIQYPVERMDWTPDSNLGLSSFYNVPEKLTERCIDIVTVDTPKV